jgi:prepilin-type N-terminal cleavage/methylation domain-containing protein/prepilin-type processing-associated H-X9-DG protein
MLFVSFVTALSREGQMVRRILKKGFTLIELLVVIAIIAILISLLLPAVQKVREAAARTQCQNNLKQIALAVHGYHDTYKQLPQGVCSNWVPNPPHYYWSWLAQILPFVEQQNLYNLADTWAKQGSSMGPPGTGWYAIPGPQPPYFWWPWGDFWAGFATTGTPNPALATLVPLYTCPADPRVLTANWVQDQGMAASFTSYLGVSGSPSSDWAKGDNANNGMFYFGSQLRLLSVTDGLSGTLMIGERPPSADLAFGWWFAGAGWDGSGTGDVVLGAQETYFATTGLASIGLGFGSCSASYAMYQPGNPTNECDIVHFYSMHTGGANWALGDGSVRYIAYSASNLIPALATRNGGEVVNGDY